MARYRDSFTSFFYCIQDVHGAAILASYWMKAREAPSSTVHSMINVPHCQI
jgi:hypothetical protein